MPVFRRPAVKWTMVFLLFVFAAVGVLTVLAQTFDPVRVVYKQLKADSQYAYDVIRPEHSAIDFATLVQIDAPEKLDDLQERLRMLVYGDRDIDRDPGQIYPTGHPWPRDEGVLEWDPVASVTRYFATPGPGVLMVAALLQPAEEDWNSRFVIYQHGMAGTFDQSRGLLEALLGAGYKVLAFDQLGYGANSRRGPCLESAEECRGNLQFDFHQLELPLRSHIEPLRAAVDLALAKGAMSVDAIGFSAGAGTVTLASAVEPRLKRTIAIAGVLPEILREGQDQAFGLAWEIIKHPEISFLDLFVAASSGEGRHYVQIFNRYDRCCFRNTKGLLYKDAISDAADEIGEGGGFDVLIDETHAEHEISDWAVARVLDLLAEGR